jgi:hypothetical protein
MFPSLNDGTQLQSIRALLSRKAATDRFVKATHGGDLQPQNY